MVPKQGSAQHWESASDAELGRAIRAGISAGLHSLIDQQAGEHKGVDLKAVGRKARGLRLPRTKAAHRAADEAFAEMYRRHQGAVLAYARTCCRDPHTAEDLAAESFTQTLRAVRAGTGPDAAWRPYLLSVVRHTAAQWMSTSRRVQLSQDFHAWAEHLSAPGSDVEQAMLESEDRSLVIRAFQSLPERWQLVLWHTEVEREPADAVGIMLGITPSGVSSLAQRAREGLREAYLQAHLARMDNEICRPYAGLLAATVRRSGARRSKAFERHIAECSPCATAQAELTGINERLGSALPAGLSLWGPACTSSRGQEATTPGIAVPEGADDLPRGDRADQDGRPGTHPDDPDAGAGALGESRPSVPGPRKAPATTSRAAAAGVAGLLTTAILTCGVLLTSSRPSDVTVTPDLPRRTTRTDAADDPTASPLPLAMANGEMPLPPGVQAASPAPLLLPRAPRPPGPDPVPSPPHPEPPDSTAPGTPRHTDPPPSARPAASSPASPVSPAPGTPGPLLPIPKGNWSLLYADSEELYGESGRAANAFDGDPNTFWHTAWYYSSDDLPHEIRIDLGATYVLEGLAYLPRQDGGTNGTIGDYKIYVSASPGAWGKPVARGTFADSTAEHFTVFGAKTGRYVRLVALSEAGSRGPWTSAAEISLTGRTPADR
ncbi:sigma-70 family RNA polymerase sigma factor [Streptomyces actinomycinicus]|uniref:Sigma-70 family RNA polymerase sigma factor n=1 Tax=Streptomyces actinomycinicus TaxID=1695166 RepID=A0A937JRA6_9ACTN|nr:sigma-70 family RNA polymerase sigma factor [Streptomyces actinomycinicus]MBL1087565.1 sigma-70 family RNA polymerase sigma factor [Streptomyces actinomycinicus]